MAILKNSAGTAVTLFTHTANLANNTTAEPSGTPPIIWDLSGSGQRDLFANFELTGTWAATPTGAGFFRVWLLPSRDPSGSTYPDGSSSFTPLIASTVNFPVAALTTQQIIAAPMRLQLAPTKYKIVIRNEAGSQLNAATANAVLRAFTWNLEQ